MLLLDQMLANPPKFLLVMDMTSLKRATCKCSNIKTKKRQYIMQLRFKKGSKMKQKTKDLPAIKLKV